MLELDPALRSRLLPESLWPSDWLRPDESLLDESLLDESLLDESLRDELCSSEDESLMPPSCELFNESSMSSLLLV